MKVEGFLSKYIFGNSLSCNPYIKKVIKGSQAIKTYISSQAKKRDRGLGLQEEKGNS